VEAFHKFNCFVADRSNGKHNLGADILKIVLSNTTPQSTDAVLTDIDEITPQGGYVAGGLTVLIASSVQVGGAYALIPVAGVILTALAGVGPFRYAVLYNATSAEENLIGWWDYGLSASLVSGDTFNVDLDTTNGILTDA
jgi:hypothetical protein